jgi:hypothetical protein
LRNLASLVGPKSINKASVARMGALPLPEGERVGVRGFRPIERAEPPHPRPLPQREREPTVLVETPWIKPTGTCSNGCDGRIAAFRRRPG